DSRTECWSAEGLEPSPALRRARPPSRGAAADPNPPRSTRVETTRAPTRRCLMSSRASNVELGRVVGLWRYPVKSMAGEALAETEVSWFGFAGDRRWAFVRGGAVQSGFPWLTLRERADMAHYRPS